MKFFGLILALVVLAACDPAYKPQPKPEPEARSTGISVSGYARIGASKTF
ncbi:hypothetical protein [Ruegeria conchae]|uniref:Lipoprotein n=1 Tax=Ruegeria conchae TaxID=981384 RepID=A0A497Z732_9RHOB|nr:hypothetical protein [Ruegeria conchae]RLK02713.1 hypothetical protein CLV75_3265 [Ruegeria conchae]UWR03387.1 hypothetical protein K3740_01370 [Ruegeria conchae]